jgi:hypothetical protein
MSVEGKGGVLRGVQTTATDLLQETFQGGDLEDLATLGVASYNPEEVELNLELQVERVVHVKTIESKLETLQTSIDSCKQELKDVIRSYFMVDWE